MQNFFVCICCVTFLYQFSLVWKWIHFYQWKRIRMIVIALVVVIIVNDYYFYSKVYVTYFILLTILFGQIYILFLCIFICLGYCFIFLMNNNSHCVTKLNNQNSCEFYNIHVQGIASQATYMFIGLSHCLNLKTEYNVW